MEAKYCKEDLSVDELDCHKIECKWQCDDAWPLQIEHRCYKLVSTGKLLGIGYRKATPTSKLADQRLLFLNMASPAETVFYNFHAVRKVCRRHNAE